MFVSVFVSGTAIRPNSLTDVLVDSTRTFVVFDKSVSLLQKAALCILKVGYDNILEIRQVKIDVGSPYMREVWNSLEWPEMGAGKESQISTAPDRH